MGNHAVGLAMGRAADIWWERRDKSLPTKRKALGALELICGPYRGADAEWEAADPASPTCVHPEYDQYTDPDGPIGRLIAIAFDATPAELSLGDENDCPWFDGPFMRFCKYFQFW